MIVWYYKLICIWFEQNTKRTVVVTIPMFTLGKRSTCVLLTSILLWWRWWKFTYRSLEAPAASECLSDTATSTLYPLPKRWERERCIPSHNIVKICSQNHCALQFVRLEEQHGHNWSSSWSSLDVLVGSLVLLFFFFIFLDGTISRLHISLRTVGINLCTYAMTC